MEAFLTEVRLGRGTDRRLDAYIQTLESELHASEKNEVEARRLVQRMALALQGSLLVRTAPPAIADAFCSSRLGGDGGGTFGTLPSSLDLDAILQRSWPK